MTEVSIQKCKSYSEVKKAIETVINNLGGIEKFVKKNEKVLLKPNLCDPLDKDKAATTHPEVIRAIIEILTPITPNIFLGDLPAIQKDRATLEVLEKTGIMDVLKVTKTKYVNLESAPFIVGEIQDYRVLEKTDFGAIYFYVDKIINVPKLKSHGITYITGAVKNLFGLIHNGERQYLHKNFDVEGFSHGLVDIYSFIKPKICLNIMDAVVGMEGNEGPTYGKPVNIGYILASEDAVAMDTLASKITGHSPLAILTNKLAKDRKLGEGLLSKINILGNKAQEKRFKKHDNYINRNKKIQDNKLIPYINDNCVACGNCYNACPVNAITETENGYKIDQKSCIKCYCCLENCVYQGISLQNNIIAKTADVLRLGKKCNQDCLFCTAKDDHNTELATEKAKQIINFLLKEGCGRIVFTGGEPTIRSDIFELIKFAKNLGFYIELQTNGINLADKNFMDNLIDAGVDEFTISIHSHNKETYKEITRTDVLEKALQGLNNVAKHQSRIDISHVINRYNYKDLKNFTKYILDNFNMEINFYISFVRPNLDLNNDKEIIPTLTEIEPYLTEAFSYLKKNNVNFTTEGIPFCFMKGFEKHNSEAERINNTPNYHIEDGVFVNDTHKNHMLKNKKLSISCKGCDYRATCPGVWKEYAAIYGTGELKPVGEIKNE